MSVIVVEHPLILHKLMLLRKKNTCSSLFRKLVIESTSFIAYEALRDLPLIDVEIETPLEFAHVRAIPDTNILLVPVLRAGLAMLDGFLNVLPQATVGHIGLSRNEETLEPSVYYHNLPAIEPDMKIFLLDPMLATGGSACAAIEELVRKGADIRQITFCCILSCREGISCIEKTYGEIDIYTVAIDRELNEKGYILPGVGDAGDRIFGTGSCTCCSI